MPEQGAKRRAVAELAERGAAVFEPVGGAPGVDLAVRAGDGQYVEVIVKEPASPGNGRAFAMRRFRPRPHLFILCVTADGEAWPLPSPVFERFAAGAPGEPEWTLDLDAPASEPPERPAGRLPRTLGAHRRLQRLPLHAGRPDRLASAACNGVECML